MYAVRAATSSAVVRWRFLSQCYRLLFLLYKHYSHLESASLCQMDIGGRLGVRAARCRDCDFGRISGCLETALKRLSRSQFGFTISKQSALLSLLSSSILLTTLLWLSLLSLLLAYIVFICGLSLTDYNSSQSLTPDLANNLLCNSLLDCERLCLRTRLLQSTIQQDKQEASIYESLRELHEIIYK